MTDAAADITHLLRDLAPQVLGVVARKHVDFSAAEDAVQEALIAATEQWPRDGVPSNPKGWLYHVALRRITDHVRSEVSRRRREETVASDMFAEWAFVPPPDVDVDVEQDDTLELLFMCCHPSLTPPSAIALTLRAVGGLSTAEIAAAFLVPEATMAQRISRAKQSIKTSKLPFTLPTDEDREQRLDAVLHALYLIFNEGYTSTSGPGLNRADLSNEAMRLTRMLHASTPHDAEVIGLLALMLLTDARRAARTGAGGELIPLDEQDRSLWDRAMIDEGSLLVMRGFQTRMIGPYLLQAAIASVHGSARSARDTDWPRILELYELLERMGNNPMVTLNRIVAAAMVHGPVPALEMLRALDEDSRISGHYRLNAVRGHLYELAGNRERAIEQFRAAADGTASAPERDYLRTKAARLTSSR